MTIAEGTHHTAVICSNYDRSKHFYSQVLGLEVVHEAYRADRKSHKLDLRLPDGTFVELFSFPNPPPRPSYPEACGLRHLAFRVSDIEEALAAVQRHGVDVGPVRTDEFTGRRFAFIADPDGLPIEFYEIGSPAAISLHEEECVLSRFVSDLRGFPGIDARVRPWTLLPNLTALVTSLIEQRGIQSASPGIFVDATARIEDGATIKGPAFISAGCFIAAGAYLRGGVFLDQKVSIGPGCEVKSSILFEGAALAHLNFVGDSVIGARVNFEAGAHTANHWNERQEKEVSVRTSQGLVRTGLSKFGAIVGDDTRIGANSVLSPGTLLLPRTVVPRLSLVEQ